MATAEPSGAERLLLDIDLRIGIDVWAELWAEGDEPDRAVLTALLRFVYGRGYYDALVEPQRGQLCRDHGLGVPERQSPRA
jgi:hypothetical protein